MRFSILLVISVAFCVFDSRCWRCFMSLSLFVRRQPRYLVLFWGRIRSLLDVIIPPLLLLPNLMYSVLLIFICSPNCASHSSTIWNQCCISCLVAANNARSSAQNSWSMRLGPICIPLPSCLIIRHSCSGNRLNRLGLEQAPCLTPLCILNGLVILRLMISLDFSFR